MKVARQLCFSVASKHCRHGAGPEPLLSEKAVEEALGQSIMPIFRLIYAQIAGSLAALSKAIHADLHHSSKVQHLSSPIYVFPPCLAVLSLCCFFELSGGV